MSCSTGIAIVFEQSGAQDRYIYIAIVVASASLTFRAWFLTKTNTLLHTIALLLHIFWIFPILIIILYLFYCHVYCKRIQLKFTSAIIAFDLIRLTFPCVIIRPTPKLHSKPYCYIYKPAPDSYGSSNGYSLKVTKDSSVAALIFLYYLLFKNIYILPVVYAVPRTGKNIDGMAMIE